MEQALCQNLSRQNLSRQNLSRWNIGMLKLETVYDAISHGATLIVGGSADVLSIGELEGACTRILSRKPKDVTVDLSELNFVCSLAIGELVKLQRATRAAGGSLQLANVPPPIYQCLHRARLDEVFTIVVRGTPK